jgi:hypothetical protein
MGLAVGSPWADHGRERGIFVVRKWDGDQVTWASRKLGGDHRPGRAGFISPTPEQFAALGLVPEVASSTPNVIVQAGWQRIFEKATGNAGQAYDATHTRIGVGTATAATATNQTDLQAATGSANRQWKLVGTAWATAAGTGTLRWTTVASFASGEGNFAWAEFGCDAGTADGVAASTAPLLNRAVSALGTKASPAVWTATLQIDFS